MHTQNSAGQTFLYYYSDKLCIFKIDIKMDMTITQKQNTDMTIAYPKQCWSDILCTPKRDKKHGHDQDMGGGGLKA